MAQPQPVEVDKHSQGLRPPELQENFWVKHRLKKWKLKRVFEDGKWLEKSKRLGFSFKEGKANHFGGGKTL